GLVQRQGPVSNQGHVPQENIQKLGQFIKGGISQKTANTSDPGIVVDLEEYRSLSRRGILIQMFKGGDLLIGIPVHRSELVKIKDAITPSCPFGNIKNRPARLQSNRYRDQHKKRRQDQQTHGRDQNIESPFTGRSPRTAIPQILFSQPGRGDSGLGLDLTQE